MKAIVTFSDPLAIETAEGASLKLSVGDMPAAGPAQQVRPRGCHAVTFIDYDGSVVKTVYVAPGGRVEKLPTEPDRAAEGLVFREWNHTAEELDGIVRDMVVGATYATSDGKTHAFVSLTPSVGKTLTLYFTRTGAGTLSVEWGDGMVTSYTDTGAFSVSHAYGNYGDYEIKIRMSDGTGTYSPGGGSNSTPFAGGGNQSQRNALTKIHIGDNVPALGMGALYLCASLSAIAMPASVTAVGMSAFESCVSLKSVTIPRNVSVIDGYCFKNCFGIAAVSLPAGMAEIAVQLFYNCYTLGLVALPAKCAIRSSAFYMCCSLMQVIIPAGVTVIEATAFQTTHGLKDYVSLSVTPPSIVSTSFAGMNHLCRIYVPDQGVAAYKAATNWNAVANYIYPLSQMQ